jgi:glycine dehydrogenase subunit 2
MLYGPRRRLDETRAARHPILRWQKPEPIVQSQAAE